MLPRSPRVAALLAVLSPGLIASACQDLKVDSVSWACAIDADCGEGAVCSSGTCELVATPTAGGTGAGAVFDSGALLDQTSTDVTTVAGFCNVYYTELCETWTACERADSVSGCYEHPFTRIRRLDCMRRTDWLFLDGGFQLSVGSLRSCFAGLATSCTFFDSDFDRCVRLATTGYRAVGDLCASDNACQPEGYCSGSSFECTGTCVDHVADGGSCSSGLCGGDSWCGSSGLCEPLPSWNDAATSTGWCEPGYVSSGGVCVPAGTFIAGRCGATGDVSCLLVDRCGEDDAAGSCTATLRAWAGEGEPCSTATSSGVSQACQLGLVCDWDDYRCRQPLTLGSWCDPANDNCYPFGVCGASGTCETLPTAGESCSAAYCADGILCLDSGDDQLCYDFYADGVSCQYDYQCASFRCDPDAGVCRSECF